MQNTNFTRWLQRLRSAALGTRAWAQARWGHTRRLWAGWRAPRPKPLAQPGAPASPPVTTTPAPPPLQRCATVVIPALNEAARIASVVRYALADPATAEVIVIDDSSIDDTAELARQAGARVVTSSMLGKGASMHDGMLRAGQDLVAYLDGDLHGLRPGIVSDLCGPLLRGEADLVKARFGRASGRVTELTAKPMLKVFFPELAHLGQPLGGVMAARRSLLQTLTFENGYGVDIALVIDAHRAGARVAEVDIGSLQHDSQSLLDLTAMANEISHVIHDRARAAGRLHVDQISRMYEAQANAAADIEHVLSRRRGRQRLLLLDMDGTVTAGRFVHHLARATGQEAALNALLQSTGPAEPRDAQKRHAQQRQADIAQLFKFVHRQQFERVAAAMPLRPGVVAWVNRMRRAGFMVGLVSDSCFVAADTVRRRVFADFACAHLLHFDNGVCTGDWQTHGAFLPLAPGAETAPNKCFVAQRFLQDSATPAVTEVWAVGDALNDLQLLALAHRAFVIDPKVPELLQLPGVVAFAHFDELQAHVPMPLPLPLPLPLSPATVAPGHPLPAPQARTPTAGAEQAVSSCA
jgi:glucosyl-3-phosphoglycerate synthase